MTVRHVEPHEPEFVDLDPYLLADWIAEAAETVWGESVAEPRLLFELKDDLEECVEARTDKPDYATCRFCSTVGYADGFDKAAGRPIVVPFWDRHRQWWSEEMAAYDVEWDPTITF